MNLPRKKSGNVEVSKGFHKNAVEGQGTKMPQRSEGDFSQRSESGAGESLWVTPMQGYHAEISKIRMCKE